MAGSAPKNSVWTAMSYTPPRGRCNFKTSLMSPACPCLRFMLHPVKAATSFDCDGCAHHASYHSLENPAEDAVLKKWNEQEVSYREAQSAGRNKRKRITTGSIVDDNVDEEPVFVGSSSVSSRRRMMREGSVDAGTSSGSRTVAPFSSSKADGSPQGSIHDTFQRRTSGGRS